LFWKHASRVFDGVEEGITTMDTAEVI
jgi:hypothetical protein